MRLRPSLLSFRVYDLSSLLYCYSNAALVPVEAPMTVNLIVIIQYEQMGRQIFKPCADDLNLKIKLHVALRTLKDELFTYKQIDINLRMSPNNERLNIGRLQRLPFSSCFFPKVAHHVDGTDHASPNC
jgi:hypothetical protein